MDNDCVPVKLPFFFFFFFTKWAVDSSLPVSCKKNCICSWYHLDIKGYHNQLNFKQKWEN